MQDAVQFRPVRLGAGSLFDYHPHAAGRAKLLQLKIGVLVESDPRPMNWSTLKYVIQQRGESARHRFAGGAPTRLPTCNVVPKTEPNWQRIPC
jgi:hypothetical protein